MMEPCEYVIQFCSQFWLTLFVNVHVMCYDDRRSTWIAKILKKVKILCTTWWVNRRTCSKYRKNYNLSEKFVLEHTTNLNLNEKFTWEMCALYVLYINYFCHIIIVIHKFLSNKAVLQWHFFVIFGKISVTYPM